MVAVSQYGRTGAKTIWLLSALSVLGIAVLFAVAIGVERLVLKQPAKSVKSAKVYGYMRSDVGNCRNLNDV